MSHMYKVSKVRRHRSARNFQGFLVFLIERALVLQDPSETLLLFWSLYFV